MQWITRVQVLPHHGLLPFWVDMQWLQQTPNTTVLVMDYQLIYMADILITGDTEHQSFSCFRHENCFQLSSDLCEVILCAAWEAETKKYSFVGFKPQRTLKNLNLFTNFSLRLILLSFQINISFCATNKASLFSMIIADPCDYLLTVSYCKTKEYLCKSSSKMCFLSSSII